VAVAEKGYQDTSVADVLKGAGISRKTFYEHFADKEACFLAAYELIFATMLERMRAAYSGQDAWPRRISAGLGELLDVLATEPGYARTGIVEALAAGQNAIDRRNIAFAVLQGFFDPARPEVPDHGVPPIVVEATIGGIHEILYRRIVAHGAEGLRELHDELTYLALSPFVGAEAATRAGGLPGGSPAR
jgi:AcrR family transcriptional regulator